MSHKGSLFGCKIVQNSSCVFLQGNYYEVGNENDQEESWGFCGKDCYQDTDIPNSGILRMKEDVHILADHLCQTFLNIALRKKPEVHRSNQMANSCLKGEASTPMYWPRTSLERSRL